MKCAKCGNVLPGHSGPGRPRKFCSSICLKLATKEVRRLDALISSLQSQVSFARMHGLPKRVATLGAEIARLEARVGELLEPNAHETV